MSDAAKEMLMTLRLVRLHLLVRPENRMPQADKNVSDLVKRAIDLAESVGIE